MNQGRWLLVGLVAAAISIAACGGTSLEPGANAATADDGTESESTAASEDSATTIAAAEERVTCQVPEPPAIPLGEPFDGEVLGFDECFVVEVPAGAATLTIELTGLQDQLNLTAGYDDPETILFNTGAFWASRQDGLADESIVIENPEPGTYYINVAVATSRNESPFTLTVSTS